MDFQNLKTHRKLIFLWDCSSVCDGHRRNDTFCHGGWHCVMDNISLTIPFDQRPLPSSSSYQCSTYEREIRRSIDKKGGERTSTTNDEISKWSPNNDDENGDESTAGSSNNNNYLYPQGPNGPCDQNL